jgi:hypothetical protein
MTIGLEECNTEEQRYGVRYFWGAKGTNAQRIFTNKCFLFIVGSACRVKRFTSSSRNSLKDAGKAQTMPDQVQNWLRQRVFDALVKQWDKCISVDGGYVEK